ncbi:MAG TPA: hypothetical protein VIP11_18250 [Gemmatimonadaceae bacterium]
MRGVASGVCVKQALEGFLARNYRLTLQTDAIYGLGLEAKPALIESWRARGIQMMTTAEYMACTKSPASVGS